MGREAKIFTKPLLRLPHRAELSLPSTRCVIRVLRQKTSVPPTQPFRHAVYSLMAAAVAPERRRFIDYNGLARNQSFPSEGQADLIDPDPARMPPSKPRRLDCIVDGNRTDAAIIDHRRFIDGPRRFTHSTALTIEKFIQINMINDRCGYDQHNFGRSGSASPPIFFWLFVS